MHQLNTVFSCYHWPCCVQFVCT